MLSTNTGKKHIRKTISTETGDPMPNQTRKIGPMIVFVW